MNLLNKYELEIGCKIDPLSISVSGRDCEIFVDNFEILNDYLIKLYTLEKYLNNNYYHYDKDVWAVSYVVGCFNIYKEELRSDDYFCKEILNYLKAFFGDVL